MPLIRVNIPARMTSRIKYHKSFRLSNKPSTKNIHMNKHFIYIFILIIHFFSFTGCTVNYSFSGATVSPEIETFSVVDFENRAPSFQPQLGYVLTNTLKDKIESETRLKLVNRNADVHFKGTITDYRVSPVSITGNDQAAKTRLTITIKVDYVNTINPDDNFSANFSRYEDFKSDKNLSDVEEELNQEISDRLVEDIFKKAFSNW